MADLTGRHPSTQQVMRFFRDDLPAELQEVSDIFRSAADAAVELLPDDPELTTCIRKLREAKDSAVGLAAVEGRRR